MFERLSDGFANVFRKLSGKGSISEGNVAEAMDDVRTALLEADVHIDVVDAFLARVKQDALGREVTKSLQPGQEFIGIIHDRLVEFLGGQVQPADAGATGMPGMGVPGMPGIPGMGPGMGAGEDPILRVSPGPTVIMMCGLQGSGKTTTCGKLAGYLKKRGRSVLLVAADLQRPAAVEQLHTVAETVNRDLAGGAQVSFYSEPDKVAAYGKAVGVAVQVCQRAVAHARAKGIDTVILDTAGRLHINDALMDELHQINRSVQPHQIMLVVDAMTGQDAINSAKAFHQKLEVDGIILTKFDSDTRGGAAISVKHVTGAPIKFIGVGEKLENIEPFHAERIATRILGMGDVVSLVEKAIDRVDAAKAMDLEEKMRKGQFTLDDFLMQLREMKQVGPLQDIVGLLPGGTEMLKNTDLSKSEKDFKRMEGILCGMTPQERGTPQILNARRRQRIAKGSGVTVTEVNNLLKRFDEMREMMRKMNKFQKMLGKFGGKMPGFGM